MSRKFNINELDFNNIGGWPQPARIVFCLIVGFLVVVLAWLLLIRGQSDQLSSLEQKEVQLRSEYEVAQGKAVNLVAIKNQLAQMEQLLQQMLQQLPSKTQMPALINDISQTALSAGLSIELFQPGEEVSQEIYVEQPITLRMAGGFDQFGAFVSGVSGMPRVVILTMHDINLQPSANQESEPGSLILSGTVRTYRYLDDEEIKTNGGKETGR